MEKLIWACWIFVAGMIIVSIKSCTESDWYIAGEKQKEEDAARERAPHIIREADGCKVYAFKSGDSYHFFTRCPDQTMTERHYSEPCGKNKTCQKTEEITTTNGGKS